MKQNLGSDLIWWTLPSQPFVVPNFNEKLYSESVALDPATDWNSDQFKEDIFDQDGKFKIEV